MIVLNPKYKEIFDEKARSLISSAFSYAKKMHKTQKRASGEDYIIHPIAVANILIDLGLDAATIAAALLHDVIEDTKASDVDIIKKFGQEIFELVSGVTKLSKLTFASQEEQAAENFRRMLFAMAKDIRVILIKLADRLHNMRTIEFIKEKKQKLIARETLEIYTPLASRLGLSYIKCELEDLCFKVFHSDLYANFIQKIPLHIEKRENIVESLCFKLKQILNQLNLKGEVSGRPKHFFSIYKKMQKHGITLEQIYDLTAIRVIVPSVKDCYEVLGMIHTVWRPIPGRFKDYISIPKPNKYQSIHTSVMSSYGMPFEIQIRTFDMHKVAEYGIAAHWKYKENIEQASDLDNKISWLRDMIETGIEESPQEFYESLKIDLYSDQVFIFTPKGAVKSMSLGSTPIDFAYNVHSQIGDTCIGAKVNNKVVSLDTKLQSGDYVEIITSDTAAPKREWLKFVKTSGAKSKIKAYFKKGIKDENIKRGREALAHEAALQNYNLDDLLEKKWVDIILQYFMLSSIDDMYASIGCNEYTPKQILLKFVDLYKKKQGSEQAASSKEKKSRIGSGDGAVIVMGAENLMIKIARCCEPVPGDDIIGVVARQKASVHRKDCENVKVVETGRLAQAHWVEFRTASFGVSLHIQTSNNAGMLASITNLIARENLFIQSLNARIDKKNTGIIVIRVDLSDASQIKPLIDKITALPNVDKVYRGR
ncbi:MAG: bifunctional (p)ppGpp synthetase/guanosine-3',5'-bis(diphosphate) 3'-pyrophosphohydrolase [Firmicutes bacterium]|nr:bifunctional (p)ppGpp synthetase/guanosine-3',5'-bis(diphosphate) 3'-pyrophosphohydrolase [Bacillota bacterium]